MNFNSKKSLISRIRRGRSSRRLFVESHLAKTVAYQIRATRDKLGWSQERLAKEVGMNQNAISRLESPEYGKPTITTLKRLASALDVGLIVRFVPFSQLVDWVSGTPRTDNGLGAEALAVPNFAAEEALGVFAGLIRANVGAANTKEELRPDFADDPEFVTEAAAADAYLDLEHKSSTPSTTDTLRGELGAREHQKVVAITDAMRIPARIQAYQDSSRKRPEREYGMTGVIATYGD